MCFLWHDWLTLKISHGISSLCFNILASKKIISGSISRKGARYKRFCRPYSLPFVLISLAIDNISLLLRLLSYAQIHGLTYGTGILKRLVSMARVKRQKERWCEDRI